MPDNGREEQIVSALYRENTPLTHSGQNLPTGKVKRYLYNLAAAELERKGEFEQVFSGTKGKTYELIRGYFILNKPIGQISLEVGMIKESAEALIQIHSSKLNPLVALQPEDMNLNAQDPYNNPPPPDMKVIAYYRHKVKSLFEIEGFAEAFYSARMHNIINLYYLNRMGPTEVAFNLSMSPNSVRQVASNVKDDINRAYFYLPVIRRLKGLTTGQEHTRAPLVVSSTLLEVERIPEEYQKTVTPKRSRKYSRTKPIFRHKPKELSKTEEASVLEKLKSQMESWKKFLDAFKIPHNIHDNVLFGISPDLNLTVLSDPRLSLNYLPVEMENADARTVDLMSRLLPHLNLDSVASIINLDLLKQSPKLHSGWNTVINGTDFNRTFVSSEEAVKFSQTNNRSIQSVFEFILESGYREWLDDRKFPVQYPNHSIVSLNRTHLLGQASFDFSGKLRILVGAATDQIEGIVGVRTTQPIKF